MDARINFVYSLENTIFLHFCVKHKNYIKNIKITYFIPKNTINTIITEQKCVGTYFRKKYLIFREFSCTFLYKKLFFKVLKERFLYYCIEIIKFYIFIKSYCFLFVVTGISVLFVSILCFFWLCLLTIRFSALLVFFILCSSSFVFLL